ncbi:MAG: lamin tail domain-containing protein, partial [Planctomycetes bacterium]|nr:lamin tail domain-containing protein [Planctomycetota bacterium]
LLPARWRVLNTGRMFGNRLDGNWGLNDQVNDVIWSAYGVPAAFGHAFHWRVIDGPDESPSGADGQYEGDFWGIARAFENYDVRFLEAHGLEKGNLYKLVNQTTNGLEQLRYQAPYAVSDGSDHNNIEGYLNSSRSEAWLDAYVDYHEWYHYHALAQAFRHYDYWPSANKNAAWYFEPVYLPENSHYGRMMTFPFDADATWGPTWNDGWDRPYEAIFGGSGKVSFQKEYRNHIREVRDLLWQSDQLILVIRQTASFMDGLEEPDIDRWKDAPASEGRQYFSATSQSTLEGKIADMMQFAFTGGSWPGGSVGAGGRAQFLDSFADAPHAGDLPARPTLQYTGPAGYPVDALTFECSLFSDPQGSGTFEAMEWRLAEVTAISGAATRLLSDPIWRAEPVRLEITPTWTSGEIETFDRSIAIPPWAATVGRKHRVRVRVKDNTGLWSHWSSRLEFTAGEPAGSIDVVDSLRVTEIMYNARDGDDFDFIELYNSGSRELDLGAVSFTDGIEFSFAGSAVTSLLPGDYAVVVRDRKTFATRYETEHISIAGEYSGQLANGGELVELTYGGISILQLEYDDGWYPETDGLGYSLEITDPAIPVSQLGDSAAWLPGEILHGTPGLPSSGVVPVGGRQVPGDANQDVELDLSDAIALLLHLFHSPRIALPCDGASVDEGGNRTLLDSNGDAAVDIGDAIYLLNYIFLEGPAPALGTGCVRIEGCPNLCGQ